MFKVKLSIIKLWWRRWRGETNKFRVKDHQAEDSVRVVNLINSDLKVREEWINTETVWEFNNKLTLMLDKETPNKTRLPLKINSSYKILLKNKVPSKGSSLLHLSKKDSQEIQPRGNNFKSNKLENFLKPVWIKL